MFYLREMHAGEPHTPPKKNADMTSHSKDERLGSLSVVVNRLVGLTLAKNTVCLIIEMVDYVSESKVLSRKRVEGGARGGEEVVGWKRDQEKRGSMALAPTICLETSFKTKRTVHRACCPVHQVLYRRRCPFDRPPGSLHC